MANELDEIYGSGGNFLKTTDIPKGEIAEFTIQDAKPDTIGSGDKTTKKLVLSLNNGKNYPLNKTNAKQLAAEFGTPNYSQWIGKKFKLIRTFTNFQGQSVECLRVV